MNDLIFHSVCVLGMRCEHVDLFLLVLCLIGTEQVMEEKRVCGWA